ncbi:hypothetical protein FEM48_Zijuj11G0033900 [Ziziphus jujuba var. spinosa]|uniref:Uncharacterized protein n=1 Tax=Ziziphus jujuba var. spinosa TaxID=714518 RepID=A0A978UGI8_ZIZJJ|nr:hypothetical protein FEM48_Zijuj11G0033900 [Ziziphus jujuba var. spinosa]
MGGGQVCPIDHFIPNEGDRSDPSGDWVTFVRLSSLQSISGRPLRSIFNLASPSPSKHLWAVSMSSSSVSSIFHHHHHLVIFLCFLRLDLIFRRKKLDFGGLNYPSKHLWPVSLSSAASFLCFVDLPSSPSCSSSLLKLPFEASLTGEFIFCCILLLFCRSAIITILALSWDGDKSVLLLKQQKLKNQFLHALLNDQCNLNYYVGQISARLSFGNSDAISRMLENWICIWIWTWLHDFAGRCKVDILISI